MPKFLYGTMCYSAANWAYPLGHRPLPAPWYANNVNWYNNHVSRPHPGAHPIPGHMITYFTADHFWKHTPWGSPGTSPNDDRSRALGPCGVLQRPGGEGHVPEGIFDARDMHFRNKHVTEWQVGSVVEAAFAITANHGGGYTYRLCRVPQHGATQSSVSEACFQATPPPQFHGSTQWAQYGSDVNTRKPIQAVRTTWGTFPPGSMWTKNPIPAFRCTSGGLHGHAFDGITPNPHGCTQLNFPPAHADLAGFGGHSDSRRHLIDTFKFQIVDKLKVPDLPPGDYVLGWRWDCEQTFQVWTQCSNIKIVSAPASPVPIQLFDNQTSGSGKMGKVLGMSAARQSVTAGIAVLTAMVAMISLAAVILRRRAMLKRSMYRDMDILESTEE